MNTAENEEREVQDVLDEVDFTGRSNIEHNVNSESGSQNGLQLRRRGRGSHPREAGDIGDPGETRDPRGRAK